MRRRVKESKYEHEGEGSRVKESEGMRRMKENKYKYVNMRRKESEGM